MNKIYVCVILISSSFITAQEKEHLALCSYFQVSLQAPTAVVRHGEWGDSSPDDSFRGETTRAAKMDIYAPHSTILLPCKHTLFNIPFNK